jgi:hypothetical protein
MWEYQVELNPGQTKTIWLLDSTYSTAFSTDIVEVDLGVFPPTGNGPTLTPTPTITQTSTPTPTPTETDTVSRTSFSCIHDENSLNDVCYTTNTATLFGTNSNFLSNSLFYGCPNGPCPGVNLVGFYLYAGNVVELDSTGNVVNTTVCAVTPTPTTTTTLTLTPTSSQTPTPTQTSSQTPTPTPSITASQTVTPTATQTQTPTGTISVSPTPTATPTNTPTNTASGTPPVTPTPTPSSYGTNTFKVTMLDTQRATFAGLVLTEIPYIQSSGTGIGFSATTGTFPLSATSVSDVSVYGTHVAINNEYVAFVLSMTGGARSFDIYFYLNGNIQTINTINLNTGSNTVTIWLSSSYLSTDKIEFQIG